MSSHDPTLLPRLAALALPALAAHALGAGWKSPRIAPATLHVGLDGPMARRGKSSPALHVEQPRDAHSFSD